MTGVKQYTLFVILGLFLSGCAASLAGVATERATMGGGYVTSTHKELVSLPPPEIKIPVGIYKFRDQTGQYKYSTTISSFSTAVTQGATSMLIKALEDSGWFVPIEREGLSDILTERKIIRQTREGYATTAEQKKNVEVLPPLMFADLLLEGGIISYDSNLVGAGFGAKYFGSGGSGQIRSDQLSIYLRAVSVNTGAVLKSVQTSKTVLSRELDFGVFKFVSYQHLLEAETGISTNEPAQMCVLEAVEKAVHDLVMEAVLSGLWKFKNPEDIESPAVLKYLKEKEVVNVTVDKKGNVTKAAVTPARESREKSSINNKIDVNRTEFHYFEGDGDDKYASEKQESVDDTAENKGDATSAGASSTQAGDDKAANIIKNEEN